MFCSKVKGEIIVEKKIDGISCFLEYRHGNLQGSFTKKGKSLTKLLKATSDIPPKIRHGTPLIVRGELYISTKNFKKLNKRREELGKKPYKCCLSALVGKMASNRPSGAIDFCGFSMSTHSSTQVDTLEELYRLGINKKHRLFHKIFTLPRDAKKLYKYLENGRRGVEFSTDIDGLLLKTNKLHPQHTIILKFPSKIES